MRRIANQAVPAGKLVVASVLAVTLGQHLSAAPPDSLSQAIIAYGFLRSSYADFDQVLQDASARGATRDLIALQGSLESLRCDVPIRLAFPHRALVVPISLRAFWIRGGSQTSGPLPDGTLFAIGPTVATPQRVWVVFSSVAPEETTIFWLERDGRGYVSGLIYDSFIKGDVANALATRIGAVNAVRIEGDDEILLEERAEPGSGPGARGALGRVFQMRLTVSAPAVTLRGAPPRR